MSKHICAEIQYESSDGTVHSDVCGDPADPEWQQRMHNILDEWMRNSAGTGGIRIGNL